MKLTLTHHRAAANGQATPAEPSQPGLDASLPGSYFPDTRVASVGEWVSPVSYRGSGPYPVPNDVLTLPAGGDSPWIIHNQSDEQGIGRSPGQQWPWQIIGESYNFDQLAIMPFEQEQTAGMPAVPGGWDGRNPPERAATFARANGGHVYFEQAEGYVTSDIDQIAVTQDPQQAAYTIGWGSLDDPGYMGEDGYGY
jgi:hypothetical protein